ncbi:hypothetical protein C8R44DRAFT_904276 [Mycena epipterygia]|nr:hypothetical protein C8R44DRAFT_904276 [Mycena epipterygia]
MISVLTLVAIFFLPTLRVAAQAASPSWRKPNITVSTADRINLAGAALDNAIDRLSADGQFDGEAWGITGNLFSQMAEFDIATNQTKYENMLLQYFDLVQKIPGRVNFSDTYSFGHAAARAYTAYKNPTFLGFAVESWWDGRAHTLSENDISAGKIPGKNFSIAGGCENKTMVGGTFWVSTVH